MEVSNRKLKNGPDRVGAPEMAFQQEPMCRVAENTASL